MDAAPLNADKDKIACPFVLFQDLMGHSGKRPVDAGFVENQGFFF
jgi:hypothetical protein